MTSGHAARVACARETFQNGTGPFARATPAGQANLEVDAQNTATTRRSTLVMDSTPTAQDAILQDSAEIP